jgi:hypothetical protein
MTKAESDNIIKEVKSFFDNLAEYSEKGKLDLFLSCYDDSLSFLHFSSDGKMRNYEDLKKICTGYYTSLKQQKISTIVQKFSIIDTNFVISGWTGNIKAEFKNGDTMIMNNYSITNLCKKIGGKWKIIHSHESALPPGIIHTKQKKNPR